tara:strand:- start:2637 stop:3503 length:867 start_codon:yes stop_codon:yes gene_type:complete
MKLYDKATQDLAQAVQDVLEGKVKKEEVKYPHDMFHPETGEKEVANNEDEHNALSKKGYTHDKPKENVADPTDKSDDQNVSKVRNMHGVKKVDESDIKEEVEAAHEEALAIEEARQLKDPKTEVMVVKNGKVEVINKKDLKKFMAKGYGLAEDSEEVTEGTLKVNGYSGSDAGGDDPKKFGIKVKKVGSGRYGDNVEMSGPDAKLIAFAVANLGVDKKAKTLADVQKQIPENRDVKEEESDKQKKYKAFFTKALKKFGVDSPAELKGDKKKEFFDYVDANYEADNEED